MPLPEPQNAAASDKTEPSDIATIAELGLSNDAVCDFYRTHWARPIALSRADFVAWQMCDAPQADDLNHSLAVVQAGDIIAMLGVTPVEFRLNGLDMRGAELTTWIVTEAARAQGLGGRMLARLQADYDVLLGAGITPAALPLYLKAGFAFQAAIPRFFHIADALKIQCFTAAPPAALALTAHRQTLPPKSDWTASPCSAASLVAQAETGLAGLNHTRRSAARLSWRYDRHPIYTYEAYLVHSADSAGGGIGVVLRSDSVDGIPFLHVVDIFGDATDAAAAIGFLEAEARKRGAAFVDVTATAGNLAGAFRAQGWSSAVDETLVELPSLFYPVELRRPPTTSVAIWSRDQRQSFYDFAQAHITKGDMDLDRPTLAYCKNNRL
jgi:GNAT superfamily N-acetyltransferase